MQWLKQRCICSVHMHSENVQMCTITPLIFNSLQIHNLCSLISSLVKDGITESSYNDVLASTGLDW